MLALVEQLRAYLGGGYPPAVVWVSESCLQCSQVRAACERLGSVCAAPPALPPGPPAQPAYLVTADFHGQLFDAAHKAKYRVLGPTAVLQLAESGEPAPAGLRPLYSLAMRGAVICFSGFRNKEELTYLITLIHYMGGSIRKDMSSKVTHLIAAAATGDKYRYATGFGLPVLHRAWVDCCWDRRDQAHCRATHRDLLKEFKLKVFAGARVSFVGFPEDETQHMAEVLASNGGHLGQGDDCTHVVMANGETFGRSLLLSSPSLLSPPPLPSPPSPASCSTPKTSLYRRLSARLSGRPLSLGNVLRDSNGPARVDRVDGRKSRDKENCTVDEPDSCTLRVSPRPDSEREVFGNKCTNSAEGPSEPEDLHRSTAAVCSGKKRTRNSTDSARLGTGSPDKGEDSHWKTIKRLKIKDSFKFKNRPTIFKRSKKESALPASPERPSPDDSLSSLNASKQSGFLDVSLASLRWSRPARSASKLRRSVKSLTASFRSPRAPASPPAPASPRAPASPPAAAEVAVSLPVVDEHSARTAESGGRAHVVKAEWFWASVQNDEAQDERDYLYRDYLEEVSRRSSVGGTTTAEESVSSAGPLQRLRKRKLRGGQAALHKRRSSVGDAVLLSLSGNLLDCTPSPDGKQILEESEVPDNVVRKLMSPRQQVFLELLQTESNYVGILQTIVTLFKQPLEEMAEEECDGKNQPLLNYTELKIIFGNLPPIYELHQRMLEELRYAQAHWSEEVSIGRLLLAHTPAMLKAYPPFVNFFENTKEMLQQCDRENPRFHAFLKICQTKPECGRQSLQELLIRPVQRLPSISLLLNDILKHTHKNNPDHGALVSALAGLREAMSHINEDKRKTEGQLQMFDIYNDIDQCPAHLVSSHRTFVSRCEVVELSKELSGRGDHLVLFLFTDTMEVCKKRSKAFNSKSPTNGTGTVRLGSGKPYRHISLMPLSTVKRVVDIREADDCHNVFALMCRSNQELKEKLYSFMMTEDGADKGHFLRQLCRQMANTVCKADADKFLTSLESCQLEIDTSDLALSTLSKVSKFAARTRIKLEAMATPGGWLDSALLDTWVLRAHLLAQVGRALSFNKTPSKLKRAMSSMISPFGSATALTPASQLAQMRLASCNNINELGSESGSGEPAGAARAPLSVQPTRKATLRRY